MSNSKLKVKIPSPSYSNNLILFDNDKDNISHSDNYSPQISIQRSIALQYQLKLKS